MELTSEHLELLRAAYVFGGRSAPLDVKAYVEPDGVDPGILIVFDPRELTKVYRVVLGWKQDGRGYSTGVNLSGPDLPLLIRLVPESDRERLRRANCELNTLGQELDEDA